MSIVRLERVSKRYRGRGGTVDAVVDVSLALDAGSLVGLMGPSGSGKTTLLNLVVDWERPDGGRIDWPADVGDDWQSVSVVPQGIGLLPELTLAENIELAHRLGNAQRQTTGQLLAALGLSGLERRTADELSLGEQQRGAVARAVAPLPRLLVADEPTAHQDELNSDRVVGLLTAVAAAGSAVLVATHDERILSHFDRVIRMEDGRLLDAEG